MTYSVFKQYEWNLLLWYKHATSDDERIQNLLSLNNLHQSVDSDCIWYQDEETGQLVTKLKPAMTEVEEFDKGNARREAIIEQRERHVQEAI